MEHVILLGFVLSGEVMKEIASSSKTKSKIKLKEKHAFDAQAFSIPPAGRMVGKFRGKKEPSSGQNPKMCITFRKAV